MAGDIPFHCHLVDHEDNGMMAVLRIVQAGAAPRPVATRTVPAPRHAAVVLAAAGPDDASLPPAMKESICRAKPATPPSR